MIGAFRSSRQKKCQTPIILAVLLGDESVLQRGQKVTVCDWWISIRFVSFCVSRYVPCNLIATKTQR